MKKKQKVLNKILKKLNLGQIKEITEDTSSLYKVVTDNKTLIVKHYNKEIINNNDVLNKQREIAVCTILSENGVPTILPLQFDDKYLIKYQKDYFLIYDNYTSKPISYNELTKKSIKKIANTIAIIHKLNIQTNLPCLYKKVFLKLNDYVDKITDNKLKEIITKNENKLQELIDCSNSNIDLIKEDLCINPNNYNIENILWENDYMYLINFDKVFMSNPIVSLAQLAYDISTNDNIFNIDYYNEFITTYLKKYGDIELDFGIALISSMNPKLQDLETLLESNNYEESIKVLEDILLFLNNKDNMLNSFNDYIKEATEKKNKKKKKNISI